MPDDSEQQHASGAMGVRVGPLEAGDRVGEYVVIRSLGSSAAGHAYLARIAPDEMDEQDGAGPDGVRPPGPLDPVFHLIERPAGGHDAIRPLLSVGLHHPRILAPRGIISQDDRDYLVVDAAGDAGDGDGEADASGPIDVAAALAAGVALADALTYLHRNGVVHLRVSPATVTMAGGRAQLAGIEEAQLIHPLDPQAAPLFARDANFLARTLGVLAAVGEEAPERSDAATMALAGIVARGAANGFATAEEVGAACSANLPHPEPSLPVTQPQPGGGQLTYSVASATSVGRVRSENQDASASAVFEVRDDVSAGEGAGMPGAIFLVADGMGGEERGELASRIAARTVVGEAAQELLVPIVQTPVEAAAAGLAEADVALPSLADALVRAAHEANARIRKLAATLGRTTGTTLTAMAAAGTRAALIHVGDSRAYLLRAGELIQLTEDHTLLARLQALDHPLLHDPAFAMPRNYLYRSLGQDDEAEVDSAELTLGPGDRLLLCSDGLWDEVEPELLARLLSEAATAQECARALVNAADAAGGHDNSTAVVVFVGADAGADVLARDEGPTLKLEAAREQS
jgi:serine/threonine protein phosphatase PrpC